MFAIGSAGTLGLGVWLLRQGELSTGAVLVLFRFAQMIQEPLERIAEQMREFRKAAAGARRAGRMLATEPRDPRRRRHAASRPGRCRSSCAT